MDKITIIKGIIFDIRDKDSKEKNHTWRNNFLNRFGVIILHETDTENHYYQMSFVPVGEGAGDYLHTTSGTIHTTHNILTLKTKNHIYKIATTPVVPTEAI